MPLDEQGAKWACEPCIRGHRSSKCEHFDRLMVKVAKAGRPLMKCPHPGQMCDCRKKYALMVRIPKGASCFCRPVYEVSSASKDPGPPAIPVHVMQQATQSKLSNGLDEATEKREFAHSHDDVRCGKSSRFMQEKRPPKMNCCSKVSSFRDSREGGADKRAGSHPAQELGCSTEKTAKRKLSILSSSGALTTTFQESIALPPSTQPSTKRNRVSPVDMPSRLLEASPDNKQYASPFSPAATTSPMHSQPISLQAQDGPSIIGPQQLDRPVPTPGPSNTALATPQASYSGTPTWLNDEHCHCGDDCQCLGCGTHPYNQATLETVQAMGSIMFSENTLPAGNLDTSSLTSSLAELHPQQACSTMPPYTSDPPSTISSSHIYQSNGTPQIITDLPMTYDFGTRLTPNFAYSSPDNNDDNSNNNLVASTTSNGTTHLYGAQPNFIQNNSTDVVMLPNAYWQFEYPLQLANPCTNPLGNCKCGENCPCVGCVTHTGHNGVPMTFPSSIEGINSTMQEQVASRGPEYSSRYTPGFHNIAATFPLDGNMAGLGLTVPHTTEATDTNGHCSATVTAQVNSPPNPAAVSRG